MGRYIVIAAVVGFVLLQVPTVGEILAIFAWLSIMIVGVVRNLRRPAARKR